MNYPFNSHTTQTVTHHPGLHFPCSIALIGLTCSQSHTHYITPTQTLLKLPSIVCVYRSPYHTCLLVFDPACVLTMFINKSLHMDQHASVSPLQYESYQHKQAATWLPPGWGYGWAWGAWVLVGVPPGAWVGACAWARLWCGGLRCIGASAGGGGSNRGGVNGLYLGVLLSFVVWELTEWWGGVVFPLLWGLVGRPGLPWALVWMGLGPPPWADLG